MVLILVDHARPEALGTLVRGLIGAYPDIEVHTALSDVFASPEGSTVIWAPEIGDADSANWHRPVFSDRALKVVLFCSREVSDEYARRAPDFWSWIVRYVECPALPWPPAAKGLRMAAASREALGILWLGGDLKTLFPPLFPGESIVEVFAGQPYKELVRLCAETQEWIVFQQARTPEALAAIRDAVRESRREGRLIVVSSVRQTSVDPPLLAERQGVRRVSVTRVFSGGYWQVDGRPLSLPVARHLAKPSRSETLRPGRFAALLELEESAIWMWQELAQGTAAAEAESRVLLAEDGGAEVARMWIEAGKSDVGREPGDPSYWAANPPLTRAVARGAPGLTLQQVLYR